MKHTNDANTNKLSQHQKDEVLNKLLESLKKACEAMIDTIDAYRSIIDARRK